MKLKSRVCNIDAAFLFFEKISLTVLDKAIVCVV